MSICLTIGKMSCVMGDRFGEYADCWICGKKESVPDYLPDVFENSLFRSVGDRNICPECSKKVKTDRKAQLRYALKVLFREYRNVLWRDKNVPDEFRARPLTQTNGER